MLQTARAQTRTTLEFGIYRDGDNNLDSSQAVTLRQALESSRRDPRIEFTVEDTTSAGTGELRTDAFTLRNGGVGEAKIEPAHDMASEQNLARFVAHTLDDAERSGAMQTWIELTDHGAGDGGGLEADSTKHIMRMPQIAQAIADGVKLHAQEHPEDAGRTVDGVVANQCLMASLGFADALSHAGVKYLAASPETMVSPGVPSNVAEAIADGSGRPHAMADALVHDVMDQRYGPSFEQWSPAAAFDVLDVRRSKISTVERAVKTFNDAVAAREHDRAAVSAIRSDARSVDGMVRFPQAKPSMPWHADRPAIALYDAIAKDARLDDALRQDAIEAENAVGSLVLAHAETRSFAPFGGSNYTDAVGPTVHFPVTARQIDPWAPRVSETRNRFFNETDAAAAERVVA